jgi:glycerate kinase
LRQRYPQAELDLIPVADGGKGFLESLEGRLGAAARLLDL